MAHVEILRGISGSGKSTYAKTHKIVGVFDDRERVVDMWRAAGIKTFDVGQGLAKF